MCVTAQDVINSDDIVRGCFGVTMQNNSTTSEWLSVREAYSVLHQEFRSLRAFQYHLSQRTENGLEERDAVRKGPVGLVIRPDRVRAWLIAEPRDAA